MSSVVLYKIEDSIARISLNRPDKRNALNDELVEGVKEALRNTTKSDEVRVILLTGEGKDFCSGADLSALKKIAEGSVADNQDDARSLMELFLLIRSLHVPVVAAVKGRALAGGCGLASACDLVLASTTARFGYPEVKIGFVPAMVLAILRRNIGEKRAFELLTRGGEIDAEEAWRLGLVNQVFPEETFDQFVDEYVKEFSKLSKSAVSLTKKLLYQVDGLSFVDAIATGADVNVIARLTEDCQNGIAKFLKK